jgi:CRISPR-associated protein Csx17
MSKVFDIRLSGCTPDPLMSYLKALGVFRVVAEQADPHAQLSWTSGIAQLHVNFDPDGLVNFFLDKYKPTPIIGPWGARSGFYPGSSESSARQALEAIEGHKTDRLAHFGQTIRAVRGILTGLGIHTKEDLDKDDNYFRLLRTLRNELPDHGPFRPLAQWLDDVYILMEDDRKFPPLLGTGGNEGSGSYMSNFCQLVAALVVNRSAEQGVPAALYGSPSQIRTNVMVGQFAPGAIGGPNSSVGFGGGGGANPWDFLLAIEGTLLFRGSAARRFGIDIDGKAAFPFTVNPNPVGYGSAAEAEEARAELWMPEWSNAVTLPELEYLLNEGRAQFGRRQAHSTLEFARAAVTLGVSRGVNGFHRYSLVKRNGLSYFAAYLGRFRVRQVPRARLLDQLDGWLAPYRRLAGADKAPARFAAAIRGIDTAMYDVCRYGDSPQYMQAVLRAVGRAERELAHAAKARAEYSGLSPVRGLSADWLTACDDGSAEFRLALSLAVLPGRSGRHRPFRMYLEPVVPYSRKRWKFEDNAPGVVWSNSDLPSNLAAVLSRRLLDGSAQEAGMVITQIEYSQHPLWVPSRYRPLLGDVLQFLAGESDDEVITDLLWALPAVDAAKSYFRFNRSSPTSRRPPSDYAVLKLVYLSESVIHPGGIGEVIIRIEPRTAALLRAGRLDDAVEVACRRLQVSGLPPYLTAPIAGVIKPVRGLPTTNDRTCRLLASLLFPLRPKAIRRLVKISSRDMNPTT